MQLGMIGLGRMGANMVRRLMGAGHECVVYNRTLSAVEQLEKEGAIGSASLNELVDKMAHATFDLADGARPASSTGRSRTSSLCSRPATP